MAFKVAKGQKENLQKTAVFGTLPILFFKLGTFFDPHVTCWLLSVLLFQGVFLNGVFEKRIRGKEKTSEFWQDSVLVHAGRALALGGFVGSILPSKAGL